MAIDKSWTTLRNRTSSQFNDGLDAFLERCKDHLDENSSCWCPCRKCNNNTKRTIKEIDHDIVKNGFSASYTTWVHHGEPSIVIQEPETYNDMVDFLHDVGMENTNEPTQGPSATSSEPPEGPSTTTNELEELYAKAAEKLYPGCDKSTLHYLSKLLHIKVLSKWTDSSFDMLLKFLKTTYPKDNKAPSSHYEAKKTFKKIGLGYESIHVCKNDCCLFWKENKSEQTCPVCGESRWKNPSTKGKKVPHKVLRYFPVTPRLRRMYNSRHIAKYMTWHATGRCKEDGKMCHPVDGQTWKAFDKKHKEFALEHRNVRFGMAADGFNPFGNLSLGYSMWPVILTAYNLPPWLCMKESNLMLSMLIPGPKSPGKDMDIFLKPLVEEFKTLWSDGVRMRDAATDTWFTMKAMLLWTINDYPARSYLSGWSGQGYLACSTCAKDTTSTPVLGKISYTGHRRFLPKKHRWRRDKSFNGEDETRDPPESLSSAAILAQLDALPPKIPGKHPDFGLIGKKRKRDLKKEFNWTKKSIFYELEYWPDVKLKHNLDVMHIEKNSTESFMGTLLMNDKSKDTPKARKDLENLGIRQELWLDHNEKGKLVKPHPEYSFTKDDRHRFCEFIKGVKLPDGFGSNFRPKVTDKDNIIGMKSHDYHIMMQRLLPVGVRGYLDETISKPIIELCSFMKQLCSRTLMVSDMVKAKEKMILVMCALEKIYPPAFFDIMIHLLIHLPEEAIEGGPVYMRWMYPFERYMKKLKNYVRNKAKAEGSIAEGYIADEALTFCSMYLEEIETKFNRPDRNGDTPGSDTPVTSHDLSVFESLCSLIGKRTAITFNAEDYKTVEWYVLNNSPEIASYMTDFSTENHPTQLKSEFPRWFKTKITRLVAADKSSCSADLLALAHRPEVFANSYTSCTVNGVRFTVHTRDQLRSTQNSGISTEAIDGTTYYGQLEEILELIYTGGRNVVMFRCKWFDTRILSGSNSRCVTKNNITSISVRNEWCKDDQYILATHANKVFYLEDPSNNDNWRVVQQAYHRKIWHQEATEPDVIHDQNSSDISLSANLDDITHTRLSRAGQSTEVDNIPASVRNDDDFIVDEDEDNDVLVIDSDVPGSESDNNQLEGGAYSSDECD